MTIERLTLTTTAQEHVIEHLYYKQQEAVNKKLMVILPGRGYTINHPLLHYLKNVGLESGYDVLSIRYGFHVAPIDSDISTLQGEVSQALQELPEENYKEVVIVGKSLGTLLAPIVVNHFESIPCRRILLTPIHHASAMNDDLETLAVIGTADPYYNPDIIIEDAHNPKILWRYYESLNHSLEDKTSWKRSLEMLAEIIKECDRFLQI